MSVQCVLTLKYGSHRLSELFGRFVFDGIDPLSCDNHLSGERTARAVRDSRLHALRHVGNSPCLGKGGE